jgi:N-glycosidase YbiA
MITQFKCEYSFLSNFYLLEKPTFYDNHYYRTNEHFYQAMKFKDNDVRQLISKHPSKGLKSFIKQFEIRSDWDNLKLRVMEYGLKYKFSNNNPHLKQKLIWTGNEQIQEGNWWNDKFWGVCLKTGEGENNLGKLLMKRRSEINSNLTLDNQTNIP